MEDIQKSCKDSVKKIGIILQQKESFAMKLYMSPRITVDLLFGGGANISTASDARTLDRAVRGKPLPKPKLPGEISRICNAVRGCASTIDSKAWRGISHIPDSSRAIAVAGFGRFASAPTSLNISPALIKRNTCSRPLGETFRAFSKPYR